MKVYVANYIYKKKIHNKVISAWTGLFNWGTETSSHTELILPLMGKYMCFSSTNRDGASGTRWETPEKVFKHPERWTFYEKDYPEHEVLEMVKRADSILGLPYDWFGIAGFGTPFGFINDKEAWYCSEACWWVLTGEWLRRISPRRIIKKIIKLLFKKKEKAYA